MVSLSLTTLILIVLGGLVLVAVVWWQMKECIDKRRKRTKVNDADTGVPMADRQNPEKRPVGAGSTPGKPKNIHGSFSSSTYGRASSPAPSYKLAPGATLVDWGQAGKGSPTPSIRSMGQPESIRHMSISSMASPMPVKHKPSPLRPADYRTSSASTVGGMGGAYMPPLPSPRTLRCGTPDSLKPDGVPNTWVSPLDVHFSRPSTPNANSRPPSFLPKLQFPGEIEQSALIIPTPNGSILDSEVASIVNSDDSSIKAPSRTKAVAPLAEIPQSKPPTNFSVFPQTVQLVHPPRQSSRSIFATGDETQRPPSRRRPSDIDTRAANIPVPQLPQDPKAFEPPNFDFGNFQETKWSPGTAIFRESVVSKQRVSVYRPPKTPRSREASPEVRNGRIASAHSVAASSMYSTTTSILNTPGDAAFPPQHARIPSQSDDGRRNRSRSSSSRRLSLAHDSIRRHSRKLSQNKDAGRSLERRNSRERDQLHYDPRQHHRDHSGSVHGRKVDFDHPRESPFSNIHATSEHSTNSSVSTTVSTVPSTGSPHIDSRGRPIAGEWDWEKMPQIPKLDLDLAPPHLHPEQDPSRLSINPFMGGGNNRSSHASRNRSASEVSQGSIGDFYDAYYRQSIMAQRASIAAQNQGGMNRNPAGDLMVGGNFSGFNFSQNQVGAAQTHVGNGMAAGKRLQPLNFSRGGLAAQTIVEVQTPLMSPVGHGENRYPLMI